MKCTLFLCTHILLNVSPIFLFTSTYNTTVLQQRNKQQQQFRQEYRLERKLLSELLINPETLPVDDEEVSNIATSPISSGNNGRHRISRVVVLHDDKLKTFFNPAEQLILPDNNKEEKKGHQQHFAYSQQATSCISGGGDDSDSSSSSSSEDFFDNDSFWSGSLTWY